MKTNAENGDYVEIHLTHKIWEGVLLEVPESEKGIVLLKLDNGYNIGFNRKDISEIKLVKKKTELEKTKIELKEDKKKPNIGMIITGGTIASKYDPKTGGVSWLTDPENLFKFYPEIFEVCNISKIEVPFMKGSEDMDYVDWKKVARTARDFLIDPKIDGIIITQGTDTLHFSSAALSFFLGEVNKPVVLTYSQRSIDRASSDANLNLKCSALMATSEIAEVMVVGHGSTEDTFCNALYGTKVRKLHSSRRDAFRPVNEKPIAKVYSDRIELISNKYRTKDKKKKEKTDITFEEKVALVKFYPGQEPDILDYYLKKGYKGIILEMLGLGQVATSGARNSWTTKLKEVQEKGMIICATAQTINGELNPLVYSTGRELLETGIIYLKDMLSEVAYIKLGWVLGHEDWAKDKEVVKEKMLTNFSHELNEQLVE
jgi:glutamyl-tRNA(Gln) amidotransferase subunit D